MRRTASRRARPASTRPRCGVDAEPDMRLGTLARGHRLGRLFQGIGKSCGSGPGAVRG